jgi:hypothetical protein
MKADIERAAGHLLFSVFSIQPNLAATQQPPPLGTPRS